MPTLPTHHPVSRPITRSSSGHTTEVDVHGEKTANVSTSKAGTNDREYQEKGEYEVEEQGVKRKVKVVLEQKTGRELVKEVGTGQYTTPRWRHSLPFINPKYGPPPAPLSMDDAPVTPEVTASLFSFIFFNWMSPLMALGNARPLQATDLYRLDDARSAGPMSDDLLKRFKIRQEKAAEYNARLADPKTPLPFRQRLHYRFVSDREKREHEFRTKTGLKQPSLALSLWDLFGTYYFIGGVFRFAGDTIQAFTPLIIRAVIRWSTQWAQARAVGKDHPNYGRGIGLAIGLFLMTAATSILMHHWFLRSMSTGVLIRSTIISAVYKRALVMTQKARGQIPNGKIVNHIGVDTSRIDFAAGFFHIIILAPIQFIIISIIILVQIKYSALPGIGFLLIAMPLQTLVMKNLISLRRAAMIWTDKRAKLVQEILGGMRIVKFMAWEIPFLERLKTIRQHELSKIRSLLTARAGMTAFAISLPVLAAILSFITYSATAHDLDAATVFSVITLFQLMRMPLMIWPMSLSTSADAMNAMGRIQSVFEAEIMTEQRSVDPDMAEGIRIEKASFTWDAPPPEQVEKEMSRGDKRKAKKAAAAAAAAAALEAKTGPEAGQKASAPGDSNEDVTPSQRRIFQLHDIDLAIPRGSLTAIVGSIGSGKSSLLQGLMGEMRRTKGKVTFSGSTALCSQTPWIQNATVRENILFGQPWDEERYWSVIRDSCLEADLELLEDGDATEIGEKGINLSGGQKQRVNVARAMYFNADIIALDDPLSALDAGVGKALFFNGIMGALAGKTRILVTHALHFLPNVDHIIFMEEGCVVEQGTYDELRARPDGAFARLIRDFGSEDKQEEEIEGEQVAIEKSDRTEKVYNRTNMVAKGTVHSLMQTEERTTGTMGIKTYFAFLKAGRGHITVPFVLVAVAFFQASYVMTSFWLVYWQEGQWGLTKGAYMGVYVGLGIASAISSFFMGYSNAILNFFASRRLHNDAIRRVMFAPQWFFDTTPLGRIMNRFSKDIDTLDNTLPDAIRMATGTLSNIMGATILLAIIQPYFLIAMFGVTILYIHNARFYRRSSIEFKRIDAILRSSLYSHFSESLSGIATIRSYGVAGRFCHDNVDRMDVENRAYYLTIINQRWLGIRLDLLGALLSFCVAIIVVTVPSVSPAKGGLALSTMVAVQQAYSWLVRQVAEVENDLVGAERILHYANALEQESPHHIEETKPPTGWPSQGAVEFSNVRMKYREELPNVLKGLTLSVGASEKIGVVGRTGAGKSSIMIALFRMSELSGGSITIDGVDISKIGLSDLRSGISIIPQDPLLFSGTLRSNIDPFNTKNDADLYDALRRAHLVQTTTPSDGGPSASEEELGNSRRFTLDTAIEEEGANLSVGERSLVSLARALVRDTKILVLDEATASVDVETDAKIQETIRTQFRDRTLLCIAHRLRTILSYDRILVMSDGQVEEFDTPENLFMARGAFHEMCDKGSISLEDIRAATALRF